MTTSQNNTLAGELAKSLEAATTLMNSLLVDIKDNASSLAIVKAKLESLSDNVESLSNIVQDGDGKGSMVTRLALIERSIEDIEEGFDEIKSGVHRALKEIKESIKDDKKTEKEGENKEKEFKRQQLLARLKILGVIAPGAIALAILIIKMLMGEAPTQ